MHIDVVGDTLYAAVTAAAMSQVGHDVHWWLPEGRHAQMLAEGREPWREPGLVRRIEDERRSGRLRVAALAAFDAERAQHVFLALFPDQRALADALIDQLAGCAALALVVNQSNFPVGSTEELTQRLRESASKVPVAVLPEALQEGRAWDGFTRSEYVILGVADATAEKLLRELLRPFNRRRDVIRVMTPREAEFSKLAISGMLATRLSYMNDMAELADSLGVDIEQVRQAVGADPRIGEAYLYPGCGFGGPGLSGSALALSEALADQGVRTRLLDEVLRINERQKEALFRKFWQHYRGQVSGRRVALWGVAFRPGTDRVENAPALVLLQALWAQGVTVHVHDPEALPALSAWAGERADLVLHQDPYAALEQADALMLVTEWKPYWSPDWTRIKQVMAAPLVLDGRNIYDPTWLQEQGFSYYGIGRA